MKHVCLRVLVHEARLQFNERKGRMFLIPPGRVKTAHHYVLLDIHDVDVVLGPILFLRYTADHIRLIESNKSEPSKSLNR